MLIRVKRRLNSADVLEMLADAMISRGMPGYIRSDNGPELVAMALRGWIAGVGAQTASIEPDSPWENGNCESFKLAVEPRVRLIRRDRRSLLSRLEQARRTVLARVMSTGLRSWAAGHAH